MQWRSLATLAGAAPILVVLTTVPLAAQLPSASARALGMGENYTAAARGYDAVRWNPAGLAMPGSPAWSLTILPVLGLGGMDPVTIDDLNEYEDEQVPAQVRRDWLNEIRAEGSQAGSGGGDLTLLALSVGRFGFQLGSMARGSMSLSPDAAELLLFGNAGFEGEPRSFRGAGSEISAFAASTAALGYAQPIRLGTGLRGKAAIGATLKFTLGHFLLYGQDRGSDVTAEPLEGRIEFPVLHTDSASAGSSGSGVGLDLGMAWTADRLSLGLSLQNVFNTFEWDEDALEWRAGRAYFSADSASAQFERQPLGNAPAVITEYLANQRFSPTVAVGATFAVTPTLMVSGDLRRRFSDGIQTGPAGHLGAGLEYRPLQSLALRAGGAVISGGYQIAGGAGVEFGVLAIGVNAARRETELGTDVVGMAAVSFRPRD